MITIKKINETYVGDTTIATTISSSSTNDEVASAKAVYDFHREYIYAQNNATYTCSASSTYEIVPIAKVMSEGSTFSIDANNEIKANRAVKVKLTLTMNVFSTGANGLKYLRLYQNSTAGDLIARTYMTSTYRESMSLVACLSLAANDVFSIRYYGAQNDSIDKYQYNIVVEEL